MRSYFFNAEPTTDLANHPTGYDREYDADDHAAFFAPLFSEAGVMAGVNGGACKVSVKEGSTLQVAAGAVYVKGRMALFDGTETLQVTQACKIVARMNKTADVRAFQLLAVEELTETEDIYDLELATVTLTPVSGGHEAQVSDTRTFLNFMGQPPYYPPDSEHLPYILWLYTLGFPMTAEEAAAVTGNPSLMEIFNKSLGAARAKTIAIAEEEWLSRTAREYNPDTNAWTEKTDGSLEYYKILPSAQHGRQHADFGFTVRMKLGERMLTNTWACIETEAEYHSETGEITVTAGDPYDAPITFYG